jgi:hypothetical protein
MTMTTAPERFEDRLLAELRQAVAARPAPALSTSTRRYRTRRFALSGVSVAAATAAIAVVAISSDATPSAYAVDSAPDGSVTVSINRLDDAAGLQARLQAAGVPAVVAYDAPAAAKCMTIVPKGGEAPAAGPLMSAPARTSGGDLGDGPTTTTRPAEEGASADPGRPGGTAPAGTGAGIPAGAVTAAAVRVDGDRSAATITIAPGQIPAGKKLFITTSTGAVDTIGMTIASPGAVTSACPLPVPSSASGSNGAS